MVAVLWVKFGLAPSETLSCPPGVLRRVLHYVESIAKASSKEKDEGDFARMHELLKRGG